MEGKKCKHIFYAWKCFVLTRQTDRQTDSELRRYCIVKHQSFLFSSSFEVTWKNIDWLNQPQTNFHVTNEMTLFEPRCCCKSATSPSGNQSVTRNTLLDVLPDCNYQIPLPLTILCVSFSRIPHWRKFTLSSRLSSLISFWFFSFYIFCVCKIPLRMLPADGCLD